MNLDSLIVFMTLAQVYSKAEHAVRLVIFPADPQSHGQLPVIRAVWLQSSKPPGLPGDLGRRRGDPMKSRGMKCQAHEFDLKYDVYRCSDIISILMVQHMSIG